MKVRVTLHGAAGEVTGSCTLIQTDDANILVDCGLIQGSPEDEHRNADPLPFDPASLDAVIVTHAHVDHCGRVPLLAREGFAGRVICTPPTAALLEPVLRGSARLQRVRVLEHAASALIDTPPPPPPFYSERDVEATLALLEPHPYGRAVELAPSVSMRFLDAGHVIGSASVELTIGRGARAKTLVLSGDIGSAEALLLPAATPPARADLLVIEGTYGARTHPPREDTLAALARIIAQAARDSERVIIPSFALGRAQNLMFGLGELSRAGRLHGLNVYLDSKLAIAATETYGRFRSLLRPEVAARVRKGDSPLQFPELNYITGRHDSRRLNSLRTGGIIVAGAGFCTGGPVVHHLAHNLWRPDAHAVFIGFQPRDTPAYAIASGEKVVPLAERVIEVNANIHRLAGISGHTDGPGLINYIAAMPELPGRVLINHADEENRAALAGRISGRWGIDAERPVEGETLEL